MTKCQNTSIILLKYHNKDRTVDHIDFAYFIFLFAFTYAGYYCGRKDGIAGALTWMEKHGDTWFSDEDE